MRAVSLLQMSLSGGCIILATLIIRMLAVQRLPKRLFSALWTVAVLRLLIPFELPSRFSAWGLLRPKAERTFAAAQTGAAAERVVQNMPVPGNAVQTPAPIIGWSAWQWIWLIGMLFGLGVLVLLYRRGISRFRDAEPAEIPQIHAWLRTHTLRRTVRVLWSERIDAPLTYGLLRPVILLPRALNMDAPALELILCHEWIHIRRLDALRKLALALTLCVHWFNPLVWAMLVLANRDMELICDEQVLRMGGQRRAYALALIQMEVERSASAPLCNYFSRNAIEERITAIMKMKKKSALSAILAAVLVLCTAAAFATTAFSAPSAVRISMKTA